MSRSRHRRSAGNPLRMAEKRRHLDWNAVLFAVREFSAHPGIALVDGPEIADGSAAAVFEFNLGFGSRSRARGESRSGVRPIEQVRLSFPPDFPLSEPEISLRPDFSRDHPHVQPILADGGRVVPCVVNAPLGEFLAAAGSLALAQQTMIWLQNAADQRLMEGGNGWEPARRDAIADFLVANEAELRSLAEGRGGFQLIETRYLCEVSEGLTPRFQGVLGARTNLKAELSERSVRRGIAAGQGISLVLWSDGHAQNGPHVCDEYLPDDIETVEQLLRRLEEYGVDAGLKSAISRLDAIATGWSGKSAPLIVTALVRRPTKLIGTASDIEICSFLVPLHLPGGALKAVNDPVRPVAIRATISEDVLREMSGAPALPTWTLLGAGSLGSKVALHLAREANPPALIADKAMLMPHNAARHALIPAGEGLYSNWLRAKADLLAEAVNGFGTQPRAVAGNHLEMVAELRAMRGKKRPSWVVNATASLVVRESLSGPEFADLPRFIEMSLFDGGSIGYLGIEGRDRNPNLVELIASFYQGAVDDPELGEALFADHQVERIATGQGCGSLTMVMSDARLSVLAAVMAETFSATPADAGASIQFFRRGADRVVDVDQRASDSFTRVPVEGLTNWTVSFPPAIDERIKQDAARHARTETGGVLIGYVSVTARRIVVTDLVDAPEDSVRTAGAFTLGTAGLEEALRDRCRASSGTLRVLGTWHSHLGSRRPSAIDRRSAALVSSSSPGPVVFLILGVDGYSALAEAPQIPESQ
jgi:integrative and conjugative element protein (TIGR02256 family)